MNVWWLYALPKIQSYAMVFLLWYIAELEMRFDRLNVGILDAGRVCDTNVVWFCLSNGLFT